VTAPRAGAVKLRQSKCSVCKTAPVAMRGVAFCFACWPGGPVTPPPCLQCGSRARYYTSGLCCRCHHDADAGVDSCTDCHAWGARRTYQWRCRPCHTWRRNHPTVGACTVCGRTLNVRAVDGLTVCRLCYRQAVLVCPPGGKLDILGANRFGQQLFLEIPRVPTVPTSGAAPTSQTADSPAATGSGPALRAGVEQLTLFTWHRDLTAYARAGLAQRADPARTASLEERARQMGAQRGWTHHQIEYACQGLRIVLGLQDSPDQPIPASDVALLRQIHRPVWSVLAVLADAGQLLEDRAPALDTWFDRKTSSLPEPMRGQLHTWYEVMRDGASTPPRRRSRSDTTIKVHLGWALPTLTTWAGAGHTCGRSPARTCSMSFPPRATTGPPPGKA
jgi:hypothetical protein